MNWPANLPCIDDYHMDKWVRWSGIGLTGLNSGWKMLQNPKPQFSWGSSTFCEQQEWVQLQDTRFSGREPVLTLRSHDSLEQGVCIKTGSLQGGKGKTNPTLPSPLPQLLKDLASTHLSRPAHLWALPMQSCWRRQCFSWLQLKRLSPQLTDCFCHGVWCKPLFCHTWSVWKYSEVYLHILYPTNAEKGEIKTIYSWRYWAVTCSDG